MGELIQYRPRSRANQAADRAFWKGPPTVDRPDFGRKKPAEDTSPSEYVAPESDPS